MIVHFSAHISKWELVCKFGVIFHIQYYSLPLFTVSRTKPVIFLLCNNLFIYQVLCTLIYRRRSLYSFLLEIRWMTSKNNKAPLLYYIKLCASFQIHWWIQTGVTVRKCSNHVKIGDFLSRVTLKIDVWPWQTIGHLFHTTSSFVHHFKSIGKVKLELQPGNAKVG